MAKKKYHSGNRNKVQAKARKKNFLSGFSTQLPTKGQPMNTMMETGKDLLIGVVGGGFAGAAIGKPSLLIGIVTTGVGHFMENRILTSLGMGMMASNGFQSKGTNGLEGMAGVKERVNNYKMSFLEKTYYDKLKALQKGKKPVTNGIGEVQYFTYPQNFLEGAEDDFSLLNRIENQIANEGIKLSQMNGLNDIGELAFAEEVIF